MRDCVARGVLTQAPRAYNSFRHIFCPEGPECSQHVCVWHLGDRLMPGSWSLKGLEVFLVIGTESSCKGPPKLMSHEGEAGRGRALSPKPGVVREQSRPQPLVPLRSCSRFSGYFQILRLWWRVENSHHLLPPLSQNSWVGRGAESAGPALGWREWGVWLNPLRSVGMVLKLFDPLFG